MTQETAEESVFRKIRWILVCVAFYWITSLSMVFLNKELMSSSSKTIDAPLFVTWWQCLVTVAVIKLLQRFNDGTPRKKGSFADIAIPPLFKHDWETMWKVNKLSIWFVGMIALSNLTLAFSPVAYFNTVRSLTIVFSAILSFIILNERRSLRTYATLFVVVFGFYIGTSKEVEITLWLALLGMSSSVANALNSIQTKRLLDDLLEGDKWLLSYYNNCNAIWLFPILMVFFGEFGVLFDNLETLLSLEYWVKMFAGGALGFLIGIAVVMQVKNTSPIASTLSATAKGAFQTVVAVAIYGTDITAMGMLGVATTLTGSALFGISARAEMIAAAEEQPAGGDGSGGSYSRVDTQDPEVPEEGGYDEAARPLGGDMEMTEVDGDAV